MIVIDNLASSKNKRVKGTSQDWFDAEIMEKITEIRYRKDSTNLVYMSIKIIIRKQGMRYNKEFLQR